MRSFEETISRIFLEVNETDPKTLKEILSRLIKYFGVTHDFKKGGYILPNGMMLDLSGERQGNKGSRERTIDHREIGSAFEDNFKHPVANGGTDAMIVLVRLGVIRMSYYGDSASFDIGAKPTPLQLKTISNLLAIADGAVVDLESGNQKLNKEFEPHEKKKALGTIKSFFN
jgi:hypothetical protein